MTVIFHFLPGMQPDIPGITAITRRVTRQAFRARRPPHLAAGVLAVAHAPVPAAANAVETVNP